MSILEHVRRFFVRGNRVHETPAAEPVTAQAPTTPPAVLEGAEASAFLSERYGVGVAFTTAHAAYLAKQHAMCNGTGIIRFTPNVVTREGVHQADMEPQVCPCVDRRLKQLGLKDGVAGLKKFGGKLYFPADFGKRRVTKQGGGELTITRTGGQYGA